MAPNCEITEVAHVEDAVGYPCSNEALARCSDCGAHLCDAHVESCNLCSETFCATCLAFHNRANHQKKDALWAEIADKMRRKSA